MNPIIIIPARMASTRLPGKPLMDIAGLPMIVHVLRRAEAARLGPVFIAAAEEEIAKAVIKAGGNAILTDPDRPSGTDRLNEALRKIDRAKKHDVVINVQGDLPTIDPKIIKDAVTPLKNKKIDLCTLAAKIENRKDGDNPNIVKAVVAWKKNGKSGRALYFTRTCSPYGAGDLYHHIGLYAYQRKALEKFTKMPPSQLEKREKLEQLRALENGMAIEVVLVDTVPLGVDTPEDMKLARRMIKNDQKI